MRMRLDEVISDTGMQTCEALAHEDKKAAVAKKEANAKAAAGKERVRAEKKNFSSVFS